MKKEAFDKDIKKIINTMTFVEALKKGLADYDDIVFYIEKWHVGNFPGEIYEFLGMTDQEYGIYVEEHIKGLKRMFKRGIDK